MDGNLRTLFKRHLPHVFWQSLETGGTARGVPDTYFMYKGISGFIEMKKIDKNFINIDAFQIGWHEKFSRAGGKSYVAVRFKRERTARKRAADTLLIFHGADIRKLQKLGAANFAHRALLVTSGGPGRWKWNKVAERLGISKIAKLTR